MANVVDPLGRKTTYDYDPAGRLLAETGPLGQVLKLFYDMADRLQTATDPRGGVTSYSYDARGLLTGVAAGAPDLLRLLSGRRSGRQDHT